MKTSVSSISLLAELPRKNAGPPKKQMTTLLSLFPKRELDLFPALTRAIQKVERHDFIKKALESCKEDNGDGKARYRPKRMGIDSLAISDLQEVIDSNFLTDKKLPALTLLDENEAIEEDVPSIKEGLLYIVKEFETASWLNEYEKTQLSNTFILDFSRRYENIHKLMLPNLSGSENRRLAFNILEQVKLVTRDIMTTLAKKKDKMQTAAMFSIECNGDRLVSTFRTMLDRRLNNTDIMDAAFARVQKGDRKKIKSETGKIKKGLLDELYQGLDQVTHVNPKLVLDAIMTNHAAQKIEIERRNVERKEDVSKILSKFNQRGVIAPIIDKRKREHLLHIADDLIRLITNSSESDQEVSVNVWADERANDEFNLKAKELLHYDSFHQRIDLHSSEDPILRAHAQLATASTEKRRRIEFTVPTRYLGHKNIKNLYDFQTLLLEDELSDNEKYEPKRELKRVEQVLERVRMFASRIPSIAPKNDIVLEEDLFASAVGEVSNDDTRATSIDFLDENLSRFKEVEELYSEIMKSVDESKVDTEEGYEYVLACPAAPLDQIIEGITQYNEKLALRKPIQLKSNNESGTTQDKKKDADGYPISGTRFQIVLTPTKSRVPVDFFRRNRKKAMRRIQSSKYHFRYNYGGYIPARALKGKPIAKPISYDDYDDFLADSFCDFVPILAYLSKRNAEKEKVLEDAKKVLQNELEDTLVVEKILNQEKERIREIFTPQDEYWNTQILDYMDDQRDPALQTVLLPENRKGLRNPIARDLQKQLESLWNGLKMKAAQKLEMAIKYGNHKFPKLENALQMWNDILKLILRRENLLEKIKILEVNASDPARFFEKGDVGSSKVRMKESHAREGLLDLIKELAINIEERALAIKVDLDEIVTYDGVEYVEKMKRDYRDILLECKRARLELPPSMIL